VAPLAAIALATAIAFGAIVTGGAARAGLIIHTIPREVVAVDVNNGGEFMMPPVPNGCYAKDPLGAVAKCLGSVCSCLGSVCGLLHGCCPGCHGAGCGQCGGTGKCGHCPLCCGPDLTSHSQDGCQQCAACGGAGQNCGFCGGHSLLHGNGTNCCPPSGPCGLGLGHGLGLGLGGSGCCPLHTKSCGAVGHASTICPSLQKPIVSAQIPCPFGQSLCSVPGCNLKMRHFHKMGKGCNACNGIGCGICLGKDLCKGTVCSSCGGAGCPNCGGVGIVPTKLCGIPCSACGGHGCKLCNGTGVCCGVVSAACSAACGLVAKALHLGDIEYFVGPGGPVPLTPGYVPYVVTTRSPRDYFAFPPHSDLDP
jgi:hypothetical protein